MAMPDRAGAAQERRAIKSTSTMPPRARCVTPTVVRAGSQPVGPEILGVELVEGSVVALEVRKKYAHANNIFEPGSRAAERAFEIVHHFAGLRLDPLRKRQ